MERWGIAANFVGRRVFRWGGKLRVQWMTGGEPERCVATGLNLHGRRVEAWVRLRDLRSFRPVLVSRLEQVGQFVYATKAEAAIGAAGLDRCRAAWFKCPLLTWREHQRR